MGPTRVGAVQFSSPCGDLWAAMAKSALAMGKAVKDRQGNYGMYATLASSLEACKEALAAQGVLVVQGWELVDNCVCVTTMLTHATGQWMACTGSGWPTKDNIHGIGSTITYLRRYSLMAMVGLAPEDEDDGAHAAKAAKPASANGRAPKTEASPAPAAPADPVQALRKYWHARLNDLTKRGGIPKLTDEDRQTVQLYLWGVKSSKELSEADAREHHGRLHQTNDQALASIVAEVVVGPWEETEQ